MDSQSTYSQRTKEAGRGCSIADLIRLGLESNGIITAAVTDGHLEKGRQYRVQFKQPYTADREIEDQHPSVLLAEQIDGEKQVFDLSCGICQKAWHQEFCNGAAVACCPAPPLTEAQVARDRERLKKIRWMD